MKSVVLVTENGASSLQKEIRTSCHWLVRCLVKVQANYKPSAKPTVAYMYKSHSTVIECILGLLRVSQHPIYHIRKSQLSLSNYNKKKEKNAILLP